MKWVFIGVELNKRKQNEEESKEERNERKNSKERKRERERTRAVISLLVLDYLFHSGTKTNQIRIQAATNRHNLAPFWYIYTPHLNTTIANYYQQLCFLSLSSTGASVHLPCPIICLLGLSPG